MCDLTTASYVATALGTAASYEGNQQTKSAMSKVQAAEAERQRNFRKEASSLFDQSLGAQTVDAVNQADAKAVKARQDEALAAQAQGVSTPAASSYGEKSKIVSDESNVRAAAGKAAAGMEGKAKAVMAGFGDATQQRGFKNARMLMDQGTIANRMAGSASASGAELDYAQHAGDQWKNIGAGLSTVGTLTGLASAAGMGASTAEEIANKSVDASGFINSGDGSMSLRPVGDGNYLHMQTNTILPGKDIEWGNFVSTDQVSHFNKPALFKPFMSAPAFKPMAAPAPSWFDLPANAYKPMNTTLKPLEPFSL